MYSFKSRRFGAFGSSTNPEELGSTVRATILGLSVVIIYGVKLLFGIELSPADLSQFAIDAGGIASALWAAYGLIKKVVAFAILKWHTKEI